MNLKDPRTQLSYLLILIFLSAVFFYRDIFLVKNLIIAVASAVIFDFLFLKLKKIEFFPPAAAITTGLIISLLISPTAPFYEIIIASGLAILAKNFIRFSKGHIFNPAGIGILLTALILNHPVSWWAVSFQQTLPFYLILISPALVSILRMRRFRIILSFLAANFILIYIVSKSNTLNNLLDPTTLFFSLVMLPEPMTTPNNHSKQIIFGIFVAFLSLMISLSIFTTLRIPDPFILSLLIGNLVFFKLK